MVLTTPAVNMTLSLDIKRKVLDADIQDVAANCRPTLHAAICHLIWVMVVRQGQPVFDAEHITRNAP